MRSIHSVEIKDLAQVGTARRAVHRFAGELGFGETGLAELDIVVQEIGTNAARYATSGGWLHYAKPLGAAPGLELFYWDSGPGIYDLDRAIRDGVSTSGSLGAGLGAIRRLMDEFEVYSTLPISSRLAHTQRRTSHGTALLARKWLGGTDGDGARAGDEDARRFGVWTRPHPGEEMNGDAYFIRERGRQTLLAVIDGLGHGQGAKEAADAAAEQLDEWMGEPLNELLLGMHEALRSTRGAVAGLAAVDHEAGRFSYSGVGNILVRVFNAPEHASPVSANGTLGARLGQLRVWSYDWSPAATLVMASDGLSASWDISSYPGILERSPQLLAGVLMRDYGRHADDATVLVAR
ncbi:MAG TPA: ATP-binding protein [Pyrinomonadaceae bacterium]|jgi:anti-sigma regulatory factor (Ser/Thr protein kinase)/serine/threonine protein phosphatase PrpC